MEKWKMRSKMTKGGRKGREGREEGNCMVRQLTDIQSQVSLSLQCTSQVRMSSVQFQEESPESPAALSVIPN